MDSIILGLAHICIFTLNLDQSIRFYTENLHFEKVYETYLVKDDGNVKYAVVKLNSCIIELLEPDIKENIQIGKEGIIAHIALEVKDLESTVTILKAKNVEFTTGVFSFETLLNGVKGAFIKGPSEELIELFEYKGGKPF